MTERTDLLVVGAGPAGLAHAFWRRLDAPDLDLRVVDARQAPGGWIRTRHVEGFVCEDGPQGLRPDDVSEAFVEAVGLTGEVVPASPAAKQRFLARDGRLHALPTGPGALFGSDIFTIGGKLSLFLEPFRRRRTDDEESMADFFGRRFGSQTVPLAEAMASGVYGGDAHRIEMASAFPFIKNLEREHGSLIRGMFSRRKAAKGQPKKVRPPLHTFRGGMERLAEATRARLGDRVQLGREVVGVRRGAADWEVGFDGGDVIAARELVIAIPARRAAGLLRDVDAELADRLAGVPVASVANVHLGFERKAVGDALQGFGFLLDRREGSPMLGAMYCSSFFPEHAPADRVLVRVMAGGVLHPDVVQRPDAELVEAARDLLRRYAGVTAPEVFCSVSRAVDAIPQYVRGHGARVRRIRELERGLPDLRLIGNSFDAVAVVGQLHRPGATCPAPQCP